MTNEQLKKAVQINEAIELLKASKDDIKEEKYMLMYVSKYKDILGFDNYHVLPRDHDFLENLLEKHDKMIREEIDQEIERLEKEIKEL